MTVSVELPGFKDRDVAAKIGKKAAHKALIINATKGKSKEKKVLRQAQDERKKKSLLQQKQFSISATIGKKSQRIDYTIRHENGHVSISIFLPRDMPTKGYTMKFKDEKLVVKFPTQQEKVGWETLKFSR